jgi:hypothetical protein
MDQNHNPLPKIQKKIGAGALVGQELQLEDILKFERGWKSKKILQTRAGRKNENENGDGVAKGREAPRRSHPNAKTTTCWEFRVENTGSATL